MRPLGGKWTIEHVGVAYDYFLCKPRNNSTEMKWAVENGLGQERRFSTNAYGVEFAHLLAACYGHKAQWFFNQWADRDSSGATSYAPWPEPDEFVQLFAALTPWQVQAAQKIRDWLPVKRLHDG